MNISIVTPAYNNPDEVRKLLESVSLGKRDFPALETIVVDDNSRDDSIRKVVEESNFAIYVRLEQNSGPAKARNIGAKLAKNDVLLFLDSDVILNRETLAKINKKMESDNSVKVICGEYDVEPENSSFSTKFKALMVRSWLPPGDSTTVFLTRVGAIKKEVFSKLGGFNDDIKTASVEDYDFGRRLMNAGIKMHYDPSITVRHHFPGFMKQVRLFFHRSFMWIHVFRKSGKFDNTCTTPAQAVAQVCGFLTVFFMIMSAFKISFISIGLFFLILFIVTNAKFFKLSFMKEGLIFTLFSLPAALIISCSIVLGGLWAACRVLCTGLMGKG